MSRPWSSWLSRWIRGSSRANRLSRRRNSSQIRLRSEHLEARVAPAVVYGQVIGGAVVYPGGVNVALADITGDGISDIVTGKTSGGSSVRVINGATGLEYRSFSAYNPQFEGGVYVAGGDINGDGADDIITGAGVGGGSHVRVFDGRTGAVLREFFAYHPSFTGGVRVAAGDVDGDGRADIITAPGAGGGPHVKVFSGATGAEIRSFFAYNAAFSGGVYVAAGRVDGDTRADIITGPGAGGGPHVRIFSGLDNRELGGFFAYSGFAGGVMVAAGDVNGDGRADIVTGPGAGGGPHVKAFTSAGVELKSFFAYDASFGGGVSVAGGRVNADSIADIVTGAGPGGGSSVKVFDGVNLGSFVNFAAYSNGTQPIVPPGGFATGGADQQAPVITLTQTPADITNTNLTIMGRVTDNVPAGVTLTVRVDNGPTQNLVLDTGNLFRFVTTLATDGSANGPHTITFQARDASNNSAAPLTVTFTLDTTGAAINFDLDAASDTGTIGNHRTELETVGLAGTGPANATITLVETGDTVTSDATGAFAFAGVHLFTGPNFLTVRATNSSGDIVEFVQNIISNTAPTVAAPVTDIAVAQSAGNTTINLPTVFSDEDVNSLVQFTTNRGVVTIELFDQQVAATVNNFLNYVAGVALSGASYANTIFHRITTLGNDGIAVLQGGGFRFSSNPSNLTHIATDPAITLQAVLSNLIGTIAMARTGAPNSATSEFFFNMSDNQVLDAGGSADPNGYAVFGVVRTGLNFLNQAFATPTQNRGGAFMSIPLNGYPQPPAGNFPTDTQFSNFEIVSSALVLRPPLADAPDALTFAVTGNTNPGLVTATITGGKLVLSYAAGQQGVATITLTATDSNGSTVQDEFTVTVGNPDLNAPVISITSPPNGQSSSTNPVISGTVTDNDGVTQFQAAVDGGTPVNVTFDGSGNFTFTPALATDGTADGAHTVTFTARDAIGNQATPTTLNFTLDTVAPVINIASPPSGQSNSTNPTVMGAVTDAIGVTQFQVSVDGGAAQDVTLDASGNFTFASTFATDGTADGSHTLTFTARDAANNAATAAVFTFTLDTVAPAITITSPASGLTFPTNPTIMGTVTDAGGVTQFQASVDGGAAQNVTFDASGNFTFTPTLATDGTADSLHTIVFTATDGANNSATPRTFTFTLNAAGPPTISITSPTSGQSFSANPTITGTVLDADGVAQFQASVDGGTPVDVTLDASGNFSFTPSVSTNGSHTVVFTARDAVGNDAAPVNFAFTFDTVAPFLMITSPANGQMFAANPTINGIVIDGIGVTQFQASVDGGAPVNVTFDGSGNFSFTPNASGDGSHSVVFTAQDAAGNMATPATFTFLFDAAGPTITITSPASGQSFSTNPTISGTVMDASGVSSMGAFVDGGGPVSVSFDSSGNFTFTPNVVGNGTHSVVFKARDLNNFESAPTTFTFVLDTVAPILMVNSPSNGQTFAANPTIQGIVIDGIGVTQFQASVDGGTATVVSFDASGNFSFTPSVSTDGPHTVTFTAQDAAGNMAAPATFTFTFDATQPVVLVTTPANGLAFSTNPVIVGQTTDNIGVTMLQAALDGGAPVMVSFDGSGNFTFTPTLATNGSADGSHTVTFTAQDAAGNTSAAFVFTFRLDSVAPVVMIISPMDGQTFNTNPTITGQATDAGVLAHVYVSVDNGPDQEVTFDSQGNFTFTPSIPTDGSANGIHTFKFTAYDDAGNISGVFTFTFNMQAP